MSVELKDANEQRFDSYFENVEVGDMFYQQGQLCLKTEAEYFYSFGTKYNYDADPEMKCTIASVEITHKIADGSEGDINVGRE